MNKPITVAREEVKAKIAEVINTSGLPAFIIEPILSDFLMEVRSVARQQYEYDKHQYELALKKESGKGEEVNDGKVDAE